jgi:indolepyruvate ferredoxin oxidoreductase alpha subunit
MAERSFQHQVSKLRSGKGTVFKGEGILAVTKALLESGVSYVGGYQGSPISHLMDVLADAKDVLDDLGVHFEACGSEASAAAMLSASINYRLRGAVTWKSTVGTNVASDALSNLASSGVLGGAVIIVGEDYGEGSSIMQERTYAFAMKAQMWLLDPRPDLPSIVSLMKQSFELSESSHTPVFFMLRIRGCHVTGEFVSSDNKVPEYSKTALLTPEREQDKIILPPNVYDQEAEKLNKRLPAAIDFIKHHKLNEFFPGKHHHLGIIVQGGLFNLVIRALQRQGLADVYGASDIPIYVMNVAYPLVPDEIIEFTENKQQLLIVEEGQPDYIEQAIQTILRRAEQTIRVFGKDLMSMTGEYTGQVMLEGLTRFIEAVGLPSTQQRLDLNQVMSLHSPLTAKDQESLLVNVPPRPSGLCTGCPERPLFSALKQVQAELGPFHISSDIGCHSFATLEPFNLGNTIMGYGLSLASSSALRHVLPHKTISIMGDGGFWHNGLSTGITSAVFNDHNGLLIIVDNGYSAATGGQDIPSRVPPDRLIATTRNTARPAGDDSQSIEKACRGAGVKWLRTISTYSIDTMKETLHEALNSEENGLKVIIAQGECMLNKQRRIKPLQKHSIASGNRTVKQRFVVDSDTCTGDHACIRISGCPSLTIQPNPDPLRIDPVTHIDNSCVGCGVCGSNVHAAILCPSFTRVQIIFNPTWWDHLIGALRQRVIAWLQQRQANLEVSKVL